MYILFGNEIVDSEEIKSLIENESPFRVDKDLSKGSKREDTIAFQISVDIEELNEIIKEGVKSNDPRIQWILFKYEPS